MLKTILLDTLKEINFRLSRQEPLMKDCINVKLDRSLRHYEENLQETCNYILSRNPVTIIKGMNSTFKEEKKDDEDDEEDYF